MQLYSTNNKSKFVSLREAIFKGLPEDNGLYMPSHLQPLPAGFFKDLKNQSFQETAFEVCCHLLEGAIPDQDLASIIEKSVTFPAPLAWLDENTAILELFHGPSLAFKDFGARFMAQLMSYFNRHEDRELVILVATSGDTGGAVAAGFHKTPGIRVVILYPSGKVSQLQEKQLTTLGENIEAIELAGTFDDCQALVKQAFLDEELNRQLRLSSANSINIARLIPQSFYYFEAFKQIKTPQSPVVFSVPSGNFGNLTAGLFAQRLGLPAHQFIAATNINDVVPEYLYSGTYTPRTSIPTLSNAMDVGNPSNFARMLDLFGSTWNTMRKNIAGHSFDDVQTRMAIREVQKKYNYTIDPHGAIGYLAFRLHQRTNPSHCGIILETAHPAKFLESMEDILQQKIKLPDKLAELKQKEKQATPMKADYPTLKEWLFANFKK